MPRDRNRLPEHWVYLGDRQAAVRSDGVEIVRDRQYKNGPFVIVSRRGQVYTQMTGRGVQHPRPRLFRYLDAATATADRVWPMAIDQEPAFRLVANKDDWKGPINAVVAAEKLVAVIKAIKFYTGADTTVAVQGDGQMQVTSVGYYGHQSHISELEARLSTIVANVGLHLVPYDMGQRQTGYMIDGLTVDRCNENMRDALTRLAEIADGIGKTAFVLVDNFEYADPADMLRATGDRPEEVRRLYDWLMAQGFASIGDTQMGTAEMIAISKRG